MAHVNEKEKAKALRTRIRRIAGQVAALEKSLDNDVDCTDFLVQISAVRGAAHGLLMEVLGDHMLRHVADEQDPVRRADEVALLSALLHKHMK